MVLMGRDDINSVGDMPMQKEDQRVELMRQVVQLEQEVNRAERDAKSAAMRASEISEELARVRAQLFESLGVDNKERAEHTEGEMWRAGRGY